jgi:GT2 family glycosyltransferase
MGILDLEFFEELSGERFSSDRAAIDYYLDHQSDARRSYSISPLIEPDWMHVTNPDGALGWKAMLRADRDPASTSPGFDAARYIEGKPSLANAGTLAALRHFLATAGPDTRMPVSAGRSGAASTWAEYRSAAIADAREFAQMYVVTGPRAPSAPTGSLVDPPADSAGAAISHSVGSVSIVVLAGGDADSTRRSVEGVLSQSLTTWSLVIATADREADDWLAALIARDARVQWLGFPGASMSELANAALSTLEGEFVAFLNAGVRWHPEFLEVSVEAMRASGARSASSSLALSLRDVLFSRSSGEMNSLVVARSVVDELGGFDSTVARWADFDFAARVWAAGAPSKPAGARQLTTITDDVGPDSTQPASWEDVIIGRHLIDWDALNDASSAREAGLVSIIIPTFEDWRLTADAVRAVLAHSGERPLQVIVVDNGSRRAVTAILRQLFASEPSVYIERLPLNLNFALGNNYGISLSRGEFIVALNNDTSVTEGWLDPLVAQLETDPRVLGTQPLLLYPDDTIQAAGTVFFADGQLPRHFLTGHPADVAIGLVHRDFSAVTAATLCMRASDVIALRGFDPIFRNGMEDVDLCLRALALNDGVFRLVPESRVYHFESRTPGRGGSVDRNRAIFLANWAGKFPANDSWRYEELGLTPPA